MEYAEKDDLLLKISSFINYASVFFGQTKRTAYDFFSARVKHISEP